MTGRYYYIGDAEGYLREAVEKAGVPVSGTIRTALMVCEECGAAVPEGVGMREHDRWHLTLVNLNPPHR
jgi:hypothetical protein